MAEDSALGWVSDGFDSVSSLASSSLAFSLLEKDIRLVLL